MYYLIGNITKLVESTRPSFEATLQATLDNPPVDAQWLSLEDAIAVGAQVLDEGKRRWLGVNIKIKKDSAPNDDLIMFYWDKWRVLGQYYNRTRKPSDSWIRDRLTRKLQQNVPLHKDTIILFRWVD